MQQGVSLMYLSTKDLEIILTNSPAQTGLLESAAHNKNGHIAPKSTAVSPHYSINGGLVWAKAL